MCVQIPEVEPLQEQPQLKGSIRSNCKSLPLPNFKDSLAAEIKSTMRKSVDTSGSSECKMRLHYRGRRKLLW
ncbi:Hypothetical predicted protein [Podarcis lilfordi]|uniref:Uncharacterized protein n=1 Tax=Podarcis lilfordi TaxID=74358 RepID=A0AA35PLG9_9SAUR|nr:Hypothetical predicted protein [Podarcis lilfordi]